MTFLPLHGHCGGGHALDGKPVGCGEVFVYAGEVFRCTDCEVPFHKHCARKHFAASQTNEGIRDMERNIADFVLERLDAGDSPFDVVKAVRSGKWKP